RGGIGRRAFVLVRALPGYRDLRAVLNDEPTTWRRRLLARRLGRLLARVHAAGFDMPDLLAKHVLVHPRTLRPVLIDWARARPRSRLSTHQRTRDLARLQASLPEELATPCERLACLRAYLGRTGSVRNWADAVCRAADRAGGRRAARERQQSPRAAAGQRLRWVSGDESLCVTSAFWRRLKSEIADWLSAA